MRPNPTTGIPVIPSLGVALALLVPALAGFGAVTPVGGGGGTSSAGVSPCNCGGDKVGVRGIPGGQVTAIVLGSGTRSGNPIEVDPAPDEEVEIDITATGGGQGCGEAYIMFPACGVEYRARAAGGGWGVWTRGSRLAVGITSGSADPDSIMIRLTGPASDTADDPTGPAAGAAPARAASAPARPRRNTIPPPGNRRRRRTPGSSLPAPRYPSPWEESAWGRTAAPRSARPGRWWPGGR